MEASAIATARRLPREGQAGSVALLAERVTRRVTIANLVAHPLGAIVLFVLLFFVLPESGDVDAHPHLANIVAAAVYLPLATVLGMVVGLRQSPACFAWVRENRAPTDAERTAALRLPLRCLALDGALWLGAAALFFLINVSASLDLASHVATTIALGGSTTCAVAYLATERLTRPINELVLASGAPARPASPGVKCRLLMAWGVASGIPFVGLFFVGYQAVMDPTVSRAELVRTVLVLAGAGLSVGLAVIFVAARSVAQPLGAVRRALARVEAGDLAAEVRVDDASEVGLLQSGFNRMAAGLRERERMQDLYSRQVGEDVARRALDGDPELGGETTDVAVLFVDLVGSTAFAAHAPPDQVVARLNRFFAVVVDVVERHGGWVNKFEGDAALCVFGAPAPLTDRAGCALAAGRELHARLAEEMPGAPAGIGISAGTAVAGWVGAERRFEYTVIGDPVNEAARLCDLAKQREDRLLASEAVLERASAFERVRWRLGETTVLRGRPDATRLAHPAY